MYVTMVLIGMNQRYNEKESIIIERKQPVNNTKLP